MKCTFAGAGTGTHATSESKQTTPKTVSLLNMNLRLFNPSQLTLVPLILRNLYSTSPESKAIVNE